MKLKSGACQILTGCFLLLILVGCNSRKNKEEGILEVEQNKYALLIGMSKTKVEGFSNVATMSASSNVNRIKKILNKEGFDDIKTLNNPNDKKFLDNLKVHLDIISDTVVKLKMMSRVMMMSQMISTRRLFLITVR